MINKSHSKMDKGVPSVVTDKPVRGREMISKTVPSGVLEPMSATPNEKSERPGEGKAEVYHEGYIDGKLYLVPDSNLEAMKDIVNFKMAPRRSIRYKHETSYEISDYDHFRSKLGNLLDKLDEMSSSESGDEIKKHKIDEEEETSEEHEKAEEAMDEEEKKAEEGEKAEEEDDFEEDTMGKEEEKIKEDEKSHEEESTEEDGKEESEEQEEEGTQSLKKNRIAEEDSEEEEEEDREGRQSMKNDQSTDKIKEDEDDGKQSKIKQKSPSEEVDDVRLSRKDENPSEDDKNGTDKKRKRTSEESKEEEDDNFSKEEPIRGEKCVKRELKSKDDIGSESEMESGGDPNYLNASDDEARKKDGRLNQNKDHSARGVLKDSGDEGKQSKTKYDTGSDSDDKDEEGRLNRKKDQSERGGGSGLDTGHGSDLKTKPRPQYYDNHKTKPGEISKHLYSPESLKDKHIRRFESDRSYARFLISGHFIKGKKPIYIIQEYNGDSLFKDQNTDIFTSEKNGDIDILIAGKYYNENILVETNGKPIALNVKPNNIIIDENRSKVFEEYFEDVFNMKTADIFVKGQFIINEMTKRITPFIRFGIKRKLP